MSETYDVTEVVRKLSKILGKKCLAIIRDAGVQIREVYFLSGDGLAKLRTVLERILGEDLAEEVLSLAKPIGAASSTQKPITDVFQVSSDLESFETASKVLADPLFASTLFLKSEIMDVKKVKVQGLSLKSILGVFPVSTIGTFLLKITAEDFEAKLLLKDGRVKAAFVEKGTGEKLLGTKALRFLSEYVGFVKIVLSRILSERRK
ncbi:MAG: hypothetical protein DRO23_11835 [Thermoprotei archaeon]|nr:MAG: hypothetical protein DRO23_11835 [Thermoprotei archaeon]